MFGIHFNHGPRSAARTTPSILCGALLSVFAGSILAAEPDAAAKKKHPPYPDVWGWEYDSPRYSRFGAWPSSNGDILMPYIIRPPIVSADKLGKGCSREKQFGYREFFGQTDHHITCDEFNDFHKRFAAPRTPPWPYDSGAVQFKDGSTLRAYGGTTSGCGDAYRGYYELKNPRGAIVWRKSIIMRFDKPIAAVCPNIDYEFKLTADTVTGMIAKLEDDTFLMFGLGGRYVVRFDKNFNSPYPYDRRRTVIVNYENVQAVISRAKKRCDIYTDCVDEEMTKYLDSNKFAYGASFACEKATTKVERLICADSQLSDMDLKLDRSYGKARESEKLLNNRDRLREQQIAWIRDIRDHCLDSKCVRAVYEQRIVQLDVPQTPDNCASADQGILAAVATCSGRELQMEEQNLNNLAKVLILTKSLTDTQALNFQKMQADWEKNRNCHCWSKADGYSSGTRAAILVGCKLEETKNRITEMKKTLQSTVLDFRGNSSLHAACK